LLSALARVDVSGDWERLWLVTGAFDFVDRASAIRDTQPASARPVSYYDGHPLSPAAELAFRRVKAMAPAYGIEPVPVGALALALVADRESGAAKALLARGEITHDELLTCLQAELLGAQLTRFGEFLDDTRQLLETTAGAQADTVAGDDSPDHLMRLLLQFTASPDLRHARRLVEQNKSVLLSPMADAALETQLILSRRGGHDEMVASIEMRRELLRECRRVGIDRAFTHAQQAAGEDRGFEVSAEAQEVATLLLEFVTARSLQGSKRVLRANEERLLSGEADHALGVFIEAAETTGDDAADLLRRHRKLLRRCREIGVDAAFAEITDSGGPTTRPRRFR
jgi:hypothetical protein